VAHLTLESFEMARQKDEQFSSEETQRRLEAAIRSSRIVGHKTHEESRPGKPRTVARTAAIKSRKKSGVRAASR
jgi:hypothetical protein